MSTDNKLLTDILAALAAGIPISVGDIEIGAVEVKDGATDTRGTVKAASTLPAASDTAQVVTVRDAAQVHQTSTVATGGACQAVAISSTSAQSAAITGTLVHITPTTDCFVREASNPTALSDGTDEFLVAYVTQAKRITSGNKLAFKTVSATGTVYIAPVA